VQLRFALPRVPPARLQTHIAKYVLHIGNGKMPHADGFWALTMYYAQYFFVDNPLKRYILANGTS